MDKSTYENDKNTLMSIDFSTIWDSGIFIVDRVDNGNKITYALYDDEDVICVNGDEFIKFAKYLLELEETDKQ